MDRVSIFIDGSNLYHGLKDEFGRFDQAKRAYRAGIAAATAAGDAHAATKMQESLDRLVRTTGQ